MHESDISKHENEDFAPGMRYFAPENFRGSWALHMGFSPMKISGQIIYFLAW